MATPKRRRTRASKRKGKITIKESAKIRKKVVNEAKPDTLPSTPTPHNNAAVFRIKIKRK